NVESSTRVEAVSLLRTGSEEVEYASARTLREPVGPSSQPVLACTMSSPTAPSASESKRAATRAPRAAQVPPLALQLEKVSPEGRSRWTVVRVEASGPRFSARKRSVTSRPCPSPEDAWAES